MKAEGSSKKLVTFYQTARNHILDDSNLQRNKHPISKTVSVIQSKESV